MLELIYQIVLCLEQKFVTSHSQPASSTFLRNMLLARPAGERNEVPLFQRLPGEKRTGLSSGNREILYHIIIGASSFRYWISSLVRGQSWATSPARPIKEHEHKESREMRMNVEAQPL